MYIIIIHFLKRRKKEKEGRKGEGRKGEGKKQKWKSMEIFIHW